MILKYTGGVRCFFLTQSLCLFVEPLAYCIHMTSIDDFLFANMP